MSPEQFLATPTVGYSDWFGSGNSHDDYREVVGEGSAPIEVFQSGHMLCLLWPDRIVITGYDGNEYHHTFEFKR